MIHTDSYRARFQAVSNFDRVLEKGRKEGREDGDEVGSSVGLAISREPFYPSLTRGFSRDNATWYSRGRSKSGARAGIPVERAKHRSLLPSVSLHEPCV